MKNNYPEYYKNFQCIASECPDTCCAGWEIVVDDEAINKYNSLDSDIGTEIKSKMITDADGDIIFKNENGRCPFLTNENLCRIYAQAGENYLCRTCDMFPRFINDFGSQREIGLGLACPEAARIILDSSSNSELLSEITPEPPTPNDIDADFYFEMLRMRKDIFSLINDKSRSIKEILADLLEKYTEKSGKSLSRNPFDLLGSLEVLTNDWQEILNRSSELDASEYGDKFRNIAGYYIYRYFLLSVFDGDYITKIKFCVFSCAVINRAASVLGLNRAAQLYSKEIEYSSENLSDIFTALKETDCENIINFL